MCTDIPRGVGWVDRGGAGLEPSNTCAGRRTGTAADLALVWEALWWSCISSEQYSRAFGSASDGFFGGPGWHAVRSTCGAVRPQSSPLAQKPRFLDHDLLHLGERREAALLSSSFGFFDGETGASTAPQWARHLKHGRRSRKAQAIHRHAPRLRQARFTICVVRGRTWGAGFAGTCLTSHVYIYALIQTLIQTRSYRRTYIYTFC